MIDLKPFIDWIIEYVQTKRGNVRLNCMGCGKDFYGKEPQMCCSGKDCGCMGMPIEPVVCSKECYGAKAWLDK